MILTIAIYPDPVLKKVCRPVSEVTDDDRRLIDDMFETMYANRGVGLAAPQVGIDKRIIVVDAGRGEGEKVASDPYALINPEIVKAEGEVEFPEGCLSCPDLVIDVKRARKVSVKGLDGEGKEVVVEVEDLAAVVFQHEIDHLNGVSIASKLSPLKRDLYKKRVVKGEKAQARIM